MQLKLFRTFEDLNNVFYPHSIKLLVIIAKSTNKMELWFPFELRLKWTLKVNIHCFLSCCHVTKWFGDRNIK
jgi:hypothetical protein